MRRPFDRVRRLAREVLWECGMDEPKKIDPFVVLARRGIRIIYGRLDGPTAQIFRHGDRAIIRVSDQIIQVGRLRFSIAHEIGHYLLGHQIPNDLTAGAAGPYTKQQEREADVFATEFLMPEELVRPYCESPSIDLAAVRAIAETFRCSIVAAAVRQVELSSAQCAVVYSERGVVDWAKQSRTFADRIPAQLKIGPGAIASDCHTCGVLDTAARVVPASAWLGSALTHSIDALVEHAALVPEPGWGGVLSLLSRREARA
jgi:Zn-dependent peptidase ImmA (M78 family)